MGAPILKASMAEGGHPTDCSEIEGVEDGKDVGKKFFIDGDFLVSQSAKEIQQASPAA